MFRGPRKRASSFVGQGDEPQNQLTLPLLVSYRASTMRILPASSRAFRIGLSARMRATTCFTLSSVTSSTKA